ncbi:MAG: Glycosidase-related protein [Candidatus Nomurabacteria bacterium GW2011_GWA2_40_9]|uniref:Glycosidase-related protein n=1 Tax=Candidatus Nomurabacteria bacterium GW2011_GWA2_40_9 TaxID=1618734 RepID=A0A0G0W4S3_9BACT|nr:MAG: Glycosidase-related protein [Candidatus Nomurabacteria bacterium GW2011_GWA2_40_9]
MFVVKRTADNPILIPNKDHYFEEFATFNMCPVVKGKNVYGLYRAISASDSMRTPHQSSVIGIAESHDGIHFKNQKPFIIPEKEWEQFGCEDPRVTYFEGKYYIFYTAISKYPMGPEGIKVAVAVSKDLKKIDEKHFVTPFNAKAMTLFPERINGKIVVIFSAHTDSPPAKMAFAYLDKIEELWSPVFWEKWSEHINENLIDPRRDIYDHVEVGAPPIKTKYGWLLVYSHIQNYFRTPENLKTIFGIEAVLLDLKEPQKIIGKTKGPMLVPEEAYELSGYISNVVFPSGALLKKDILTVYYGAADTTVCAFKVHFVDLVHSMHKDHTERFHFKRFLGNPIIAPISEHTWENLATFNPAAIRLGGSTHILYRAFSKDNTSTIGYARLENGTDVVERLNEPVYVPKEDFEIKKIENANSGCEDPRLTKIGNTIYMCYTAFDSYGPPRVAITSISTKDFLAHKWNWEKPFLITPRELDDKDTCLFPEKFPDGYFILHRVGSEICGDYLSSLDPYAAMVQKCIRIIGPRENMWDSAKVGIAAPPIRTKKGWLLLYHGVSKSHKTYRIGAVLLDLKDPAIVLARGTEPIFEPVEDYEKIGIVNNVVFPCGMTVESGLLYIYYGGGDRVVGVATMELEVIIEALVHGVKLS